MRIVIDMQGVQTVDSRSRGIGRYTKALTLAMIRQRNEHEIFLALNGLFPETIEFIRADFEKILPQENIRVWSSPGPVSFLSAENIWRRQCAERVREAFLASLKPDMVLVTSLFEGMADDAVTGVGLLSRTIPTAVILYDLIPLIYRQIYLEDPAVESWYENKLDHLCRADLLLAISDSSRQEALDYLEFPGEASVSISTAVDARFQPLSVDLQQEQDLYKQYQIIRPYVMYTGGIDHRKNIDGLIRAYARLPETVRIQHQLLVVCSISRQDQTRLKRLAKKCQLKEDELIFTGFIADEDLHLLYVLCRVFVFPSLHEGFGLPALEAMSCGRAVIGSDRSSIPEVIGRADALFDPESAESMATKMEQVLTDDAFRADLEQHSLRQAAKFSWDQCARRAITAFEEYQGKQQHGKTGKRPARKPRMAYISPLPPERSGISDYSAELLPELSRFYDIDVVVNQEQVSDSWIAANCRVRDVEWFRSHASRFERILYHFGNSPFHQHMFGLLQEVPGVVVLHDFFLSGIVEYMSSLGGADNWVEELYHSHGYKAVYDKYHGMDFMDVVQKYPCNLSVLQNAQSVIVHSEYSRRLAVHWYGDCAGADWSVIPLLRVPAVNCDDMAARQALNFDAADFVVCSFGMLGPAKLNHRLLEAWLASELVKDKHCILVFVGDNESSQYGKDFSAEISRLGLADCIRITGWVDREVFRDYLIAADMAVQLRTDSRGETSAAVLDCLNFGIPTVVNANGSMQDLDAAAVWKLPDKFTCEQMVESLEVLRKDQSRRRKLGERGQQIVRDYHDPGVCAAQYYTTIEDSYREATADLHSLVQAIADVESESVQQTELLALAESIALSIPESVLSRQLFVDVSELLRCDHKTGIQRVVRSIVRELLIFAPVGMRVEPVYATMEHGYCYARRFTFDFLECPVDCFHDEPVEYQAGDIFLGLDFQPQLVVPHQEFYQEMRRSGVRVLFVVYDLLCISMPRCFDDVVVSDYKQWLEIVVESDGVLCISKVVAAELKEWLQKQHVQRQRSFTIGSFYLGADIENSLPSVGMPDNADRILQALQKRISFLMVGTVEPRKGHGQTLEAFEKLWEQDIDVNLVIVGKQGWLVDELSQRMQQHPEQGSRFFWLDGISDEYLNRIYDVSSCLIFASEGEGFGLPLIEAARHKIPVIARDIPVFREVAGEYAFYFKAENPFELSRVILKWLDLYRQQHPQSDLMPWLTWKESTNELLKFVLQGNSLKCSGSVS